MKCGDLRCCRCGRNALESASYLRRVGAKGDPDAAFQCAAPCDAPRASDDERFMAAIEGKGGGNG